MGRGAITIKAATANVSSTRASSNHLSTLSPPAIDEEWAEKIEPIAKLSQAATAMLLTARNYARFYGSEDERTKQHQERAEAKVKEAHERYQQVSAPYDEEFKRRGGWSRYVIVCNSNGHIHRQPDRCGTLIPGQTLISPVYQLSGATDEEVIQFSGQTACSKCFPDAPVITPLEKQRISKEKADVKAQERALKKAEKDAKKAIRDQSLAIKADALLELIPPGLDSGEVYRWFYSDPKISKKYGDNAFYLASDLYQDRLKPKQ
jgi:hypothetical protein